MNELSRADLELAIDNCCAIYGDTEMIVVGSMAMLASTPYPVAELRRSLDVDLYPKNAPFEKTLEVATAYGPASSFQDEHGWCIEAVGDWTTMTTPNGWKERANLVRTAKGNTGWCLAPLDLAYNKIEAGRDKDIDHLALMIKHGYVDEPQIAAAIHLSEQEDQIKANNLAVLAKVVAKLQAAAPREESHGSLAETRAKLTPPPGRPPEENGLTI